MNSFRYPSRESPSALELIVTRPLYAAACGGCLLVALYLAASVGRRIDGVRAHEPREQSGETPRFALRPEAPSVLFANGLWEHVEGQSGALQRGVFRPSREQGFALESMQILPASSWWQAEPGRFFDIVIGVDAGGEYVLRVGAAEVAALYGLTPERRILIERATLRPAGENPIGVQRLGESLRVSQGDRTLLTVALPSRSGFTLQVVTNATRDLFRTFRLSWSAAGSRKEADLLLSDERA